MNMAQEQWSTWFSALHSGTPIHPTADQWHTGLRHAVQEYAGRMLDTGQDPYAIIALNEVRRIDAIHGSCPVAAASS